MYAVRRWSVRHARGLERFYNGFEWVLVTLHPLWKRIGYERLEKPVAMLEKFSKEFLFDCKMCGQCALSSTGMSCSMNCPKNLRNGPCGGVRANGNCEVKPDMRCVWVVAYETSQAMPVYGHELHAVQPPVDRRLQDTSAWVNMLTGVDKRLPEGWIPVEEIA